MRLTGLATLFLTHLVEEQAKFGLDAVWSDKGYVTDIADGPDDYFATLAETNRSLLPDTERRLRRAEMKYGSLRYGRFERIPPQMIANVIRQKRLQYRAVTRCGSARQKRQPAPYRGAWRSTCGGLPADTDHAGSRGARDSPTSRSATPRCPELLVSGLCARSARRLTWPPAALAHYPTSSGGWGQSNRSGRGDAPYKRELATGITRYGRANWTGGTGRSILARAWQSIEWRVRSWRQRRRKTTSDKGS